MKLPTRVSFLFFIGIFIVGSTALSYYYYFVYSPPLNAAALFMDAMEAKDVEALRSILIVSSDIEEGLLREPTARELQELLANNFRRGRIVDQRVREGRTRNFWYLVYREPDARIFALISTDVDGRFRIVIPELPMHREHRYLWDYAWTN